MIGVNWYHHDFVWPQTQAPEWSVKVERWYQLDAAAFALAETFWRHRESLTSRPDVLFLASPLASNPTDDAFEASPTPAKFVHTLPNIRGAVLLQLMGWAGEVYCLQKDPQTLVAALSEGMQTVRSGARECWVVGVTGASGIFTGHVFRLRNDATESDQKITEKLAEDMANATTRDKDLLLWLKGE